jgi:hypothetical protein
VMVLNRGNFDFVEFWGEATSVSCYVSPSGRALRASLSRSTACNFASTFTEVRRKLGRPLRPEVRQGEKRRRTPSHTPP